MGEVRAAIVKACRAYSTPSFPEIVRSDFVLIPHLNYFKKDWQPWWVGILDKDYPKGNNGFFCDLFAGHAVVECNKIAFIHCQANNVDATAGMFEVRVNINKSLLTVPAGENHCTCLILYTLDHETFQIAAWEPQSIKFAMLPFEDALDRADYRDCFL
jgi:hypothetical protein